MKINPKYRGGMVKGLKGLRPIIRRIAGAGVVRPPTGAFKQLSMSATVESVSSGEGVKKTKLTKLKFLI